jgi:hypothetical protein
MGIFSRSAFLVAIDRIRSALPRGGNASLNPQGIVADRLACLVDPVVAAPKELHHTDSPRRRDGDDESLHIVIDWPWAELIW